MFRIRVNFEEKTQVVVDFRELMSEYEEYSQYTDSIDNWLDSCNHIMSMFDEAYPKLVDSMSNVEDYLYFIDCTDEEQANDVEEWFNMLFNELEDEINDEIEELEDEDDEEDEDEE